jgi:peptidoglycan/LPS O-acetylase OafA/YrhL
VIILLTRMGIHPTWWIPSIGYTVIAAFCACLVYLAQSGSGWIARLSNASWLRFLGRYSYGLYIYNGLLVLFLIPLAHPIQRLVHSVFLGGLVFFTASLALNIGLSMLSYHFFEAPILKLKSRFS